MKESKEKGIFVSGLGQHVVNGVQEMMRMLQVGGGDARSLRVYDGGTFNSSNEVNLHDSSASAIARSARPR